MERCASMLVNSLLEWMEGPSTPWYGREISALDETGLGWNRCRGGWWHNYIKSSVLETVRFGGFTHFFHITLNTQLLWASVASSENGDNSACPKRLFWEVNRLMPRKSFTFRLNVLNKWQLVFPSVMSLRVFITLMVKCKFSQLSRFRKLNLQHMFPTTRWQTDWHPISCSGIYIRGEKLSPRVYFHFSSKFYFIMALFRFPISSSVSFINF